MTQCRHQSDAHVPKWLGLNTLHRDWRGNTIDPIISPIIHRRGLARALGWLALGLPILRNLGKAVGSPSAGRGAHLRALNAR
jgi:hypothetical protein